MLKACQDVAARHGLVAAAKDIAALDLRWGFNLGFRVSIPLPDCRHRPPQARMPNPGRTHPSAADQVALLLQKGMRDLSPLD
jgi:hypothetical protein